jgi:AcrR family transcriptional regulator
MNEKKEDRRIERTRSLLRDALVNLMIEKGYDAITVQDILDRANVGRSTFYAHFYDKDQLLVGTINQLKEFISRQKMDPARSKKPGECCFVFSLLMLEHAQGHQHLYKAIVGKQGGAAVQNQMRRMLAELARDEIADFFPAEALSVPREIVTDFVVNTFFTILVWWMEQGATLPAGEVDGIFHKLALEGLKGAVV